MNTSGRFFRVSIFGESHSPVMGAVIDGVPAGIPFREEDMSADIARRAAGLPGTTPRKEEDRPRIISGIFGGHTTGAPVCIVFDNGDCRPEDYGTFRDIPRPGHADYTRNMKWNGAYDPRGGGQASGRMTLPAVAAGVIAKKVLGGISVRASLVEVGGCGDPSAWEGMVAAAAAEGDSLGGIIECTVGNVPAGLGEPFYDSVESLVSHAVFSIPGIRGIEFGDGFAAAAMKGSVHNDPFGPDGPVKNGAGGINGGITNGADIVFRVAVKPTSSISRPQRTYNFTEGRMDTLKVEGRHDACFALRTPVIVEAFTATALADLLLAQRQAGRFF